LPQPILLKENYAKVGDKTIKGYLARSPQADAPALLVFHEWWGLNNNVKKMTEKLGLYRTCLAQRTSQMPT
jgi:dienelactone hydrolase